MEANVIIDGVKYNYFVTEDGRVFSLNYNRTGEAKELKHFNGGGGYRCVNLCKDGKPKMVKVARLVAMAYIPNPEGKPEVDHIDRNPLNNDVSNLRWVTSSENCYNREMPKNNKNSKAVKCVETGEIYPSICEVERQFGFNQGNVASCCRGKLKTAYGYHWQYI